VEVVVMETPPRLVIPPMPKLETSHVLFISFVIQLGLLIYAEHVDSHPERYGGLRYTDVDWRVISDGAGHILRPRPGEEAKGWVMKSLGLHIGE
jgi:phosphatidylinositol glycan class M